MSRWLRGWRLGVLLASLVGLLVRWYVVLEARPTCGDDVSGPCFQINGDALYHFTQAELIADGRWFKNGLEFLASGRIVDSAGDPPGFALLLGAWSWLGFDTVHWQRFLLGFVGAITVLLVGLLAHRLAGPYAALVASGIAAVHPLLWINDAMLMSESLYQPAIVVVLLLAYDYVAEPTSRRIGWLAVAAGVATLIRAEAITLGVFLIVPLVWFTTGFVTAERIRQIAIAAVAMIAVLAPWVAYNNARFEDPVTLTAASGTVLMAGSCDEAWSGESLGFWDDCFTNRDLWDEYRAEFPGITDPIPNRVIYDESLIDTFNREKALDYITDNLDRLPVVALARMGRSLEFYRVSHTLRQNWELEGRWRGPSTVGLWLYYALIVPSLVGALVLRREGVRLTPLLAMWPMVLFASATTFGLTRYRVPIDIAMIVLTAVAAAALAERFVGRQRERQRDLDRDARRAAGADTDAEVGA